MSGTVVLGVGNVLMGDEGVGVHAIAALERRGQLPAAVRLVDGGTSTHELYGDLEYLDHLIIVDAVRAGRAPGTLVRLEGPEVPAAFSVKLSPHQVGIADLLATLEFLGRAPKHVVLFGVEPEKMELDLMLSPKVATRLPEVCERVLEEVRHLV